MGLRWSQDGWMREGGCGDLCRSATHPWTHTTAIPLPPTLVHCFEVKGKDTTCTGSEVKCCLCVCVWETECERKITRDWGDEDDGQDWELEEVVCAKSFDRTSLELCGCSADALCADVKCWPAHWSKVTRRKDDSETRDRAGVDFICASSVTEMGRRCQSDKASVTCTAERGLFSNPVLLLCSTLVPLFCLLRIPPACWIWSGGVSAFCCPSCPSLYLSACPSTSIYIFQCLSEGLCGGWVHVFPPIMDWGWTPNVPSGGPGWWEEGMECGGYVGADRNICLYAFPVKKLYNSVTSLNLVSSRVCADI